jgi:para-nitrobenzyl esterase
MCTGLTIGRISALFAATVAVALVLSCLQGCSRSMPPAAAAAEAPTIRTDRGILQGVREGDITVYKGVPFTAPPVGELRWQAPQGDRPWYAVLRADQFKPQCMQTEPPLPNMPAEPVSEDCLYLNIWVPASAPTSNTKAATAAPAASASTAARPVMVFIHGGGFTSGSASTPLYWGGELSRRYGVIVVNLSYRVGALGFLAHPQLTAESNNHASGNYGLLDVIAGLRWIRRNIEAFGGDPDNVTIFGQSAGAWVVNNLMISPLAARLFHAAIAQSEGGDMAPAGSADGMALLEQAQRDGVGFARSLGAQSIAELRQIPADKIAAASFKSWPIVDGYVVPQDPYALYASGKQADVPLLLGYNNDESENIVKPVASSVYLDTLRTQYGALAGQFLALYPAGSQEESARSQGRLWVERTFGWHMWVWARLHARTSHSKVFFYHFSGNNDSGHGAELPYVFLHSSDASATKLSTYWTNFAGTGDPNGKGAPSWPPFNEPDEATMYLGKDFTAGKVPDIREHQLMDQYMSALRSK